MVLDYLISKLARGILGQGKRQARRQKKIEGLEGGEEEYEARKSLTQLPDVGWKTAGNLYDEGFESVLEVASASKSELKEVEGIGTKRAEKINDATFITTSEGDTTSEEVEELQRQREERERYEEWEWERVDEYPFDHYTEATEEVKQLKREKKHDEVENLLLWCIDFVEAEAEFNPVPAIAPWYYEHLGIVYRKDGRYDDEVAILERYMDAVEEVGDDPHRKMGPRLEKARKLAEEG